jgi:hypothetical protein
MTWDLLNTEYYLSRKSEDRIDGFQRADASKASINSH